MAKRHDHHKRFPLNARRSGLTLVELLLLIALIAFIVALFLPAFQRVRSGRRPICKNNLKQIGLALHNYYDTYGGFPPAMTVGADNRPVHSWRTLILPFLDEQAKALYQSIDLTKPWDDPANSEALSQTPDAYRCPNLTAPSGLTNYVAVVGENAAIHPQSSRHFDDVTDGTSNTAMVTESSPDDAVPWMSPRDGGAESLLRLNSSTATVHEEGVNTLIMDGSVRFLLADRPVEERRALITINGGESIEP